jgi:2-polyprenyl-3-methyl-5-hydroxy-6-metoxy-1,4-benzoquinol methylase
MNYRKRSNEKEWIDLGNSLYSSKEYEDCLFQLGRVGDYLGGDKATFSAISKLKESPKSILDIGCGGGLFTIQLAKRYPQAKIVGVDISKEAIDFANRQLETTVPQIKNVEFVLLDSPHLNFPPNSFDVVTSTLVCHHLTDLEILDFLKSAYGIAKHAIILNDLHRNRIASLGFAVIAPILFRNRLITHDGLISIKRGFIYKDWENYILEAEIPPQVCSIEWHWPFRWVVTILSSLCLCALCG